MSEQATKPRRYATLPNCDGCGRPTRQQKEYRMSTTYRPRRALPAQRIVWDEYRPRRLAHTHSSQL